MIGKIVKVSVDRPLGSYHPNHNDLYYPVNYGFVEGIVGGDGQEQDAYVLGVDKQLKQFIGEVIAVVHRLDDIEDKWVVAPRDLQLTKEEIYKQVQLQEKYFKIEILM
jgi:inorganic pyrophosphatase